MQQACPPHYTVYTAYVVQSKLNGTPTPLLISYSAIVKIQNQIFTALSARLNVLPYKESYANSRK